MLNRTIRRAFKRIAAIMSVSAVLAACSPGSGADGSADGQIRLQVAVSGTPYEIQVFKDVGELYTAEHPEVTIEYIDIGNDRVAKTMSLIQTGNPPDIYFMNDNVTYLGMEGALEPLDPFIEQDDSFDISTFNPEVLRTQTYDGHLYALPIEVTPYCIYYNADLFRACGVPLPDNDWTMEEFYSACRALTIPEKNQYAIQLLASWHNQTLGFLNRAGGHVFSEDVQSCALDSLEALNGLTWMYNLVAVDHFSPDPAEAAAMGNTSLYVMFQNQKIAMNMGGMWNVPDYNAAELPFDWDVVKMPRDVNQDTKGNMTLWGMSSTSKHKEAAWGYLSMLCGPVGMQTLAKAGYSIPAAENELADETIQSISHPEHIGAFLEARADINIEEDLCPKKMEVMNIWDSEIERLLLGRTTPEQCQQDLVRQINEILAEK